MKTTALLYLVAGAGLVHVSASPLRVVVVTSHQEVTSSNIRLGLPAASSSNVGLAQVVHPKMGMISEGAGPQKKGSRPCRFREKALGMSNAFRQALGMPLIEPNHKTEGQVHGGMIQIMPWVGTSPSFVNGKAIIASDKGNSAIAQPMPIFAPIGSGPHHHHHHHNGGHHIRKDRSFLRRIHFALMALGPWEGRAVAFVLGCGIGVLLRMVWVMAVISYRMIKGEKDESDEYTHIVCEHYVDAEEIFVAPPNYTYPDEKAINKEQVEVEVPKTT